MLNTALPDWAQSLGVVFSIALWAPSWGGMLNGLLTLRGVWDKVREDPILKFMAAAVTFYGMATFEGPLLSIKSVSALGHYTDWIIGHVHGGTLGWNGFMAAGMFYFIVPKLWKTELHSVSWGNIHFWMGTLGIVLYMGSMWVGGITQGLMWRAWTEEGLLQYPNFIETVKVLKPMYWARFIGGTLYFAGYCLMVVNLVLTMKKGSFVEGTAKVVDVPSWRAESDKLTWLQTALHPALLLSYIGAILVLMMLYPTDMALGLGLFGLISIGLLGYQAQKNGQTVGFHHVLEGKPLLFSFLTLIAVLVGGIVEIVPIIALNQEVPVGERRQIPYTALELEGRDIYIREGCYTCHSQMIRPFVEETVRYGRPEAQRPDNRADYSHWGESVYDHPFQWGSKRTGPDLHREGGKRDNYWHYRHMIDPRKIEVESIMPAYAFMETNKVDVDLAGPRMEIMQKLGVPYSDEEVAKASTTYKVQADEIVADLKTKSVELAWDSELTAVIAYLQCLGSSEIVTKETQN